MTTTAQRACVEALLRMLAVLEALEVKTDNPKLSDDQVVAVAKRRFDEWLGKPGEPPA